MFWKRIQEDSDPSPADVRSYVRQQLRLALTFATLGAYDEPEDERAAPSPETVSEQPEAAMPTPLSHGTQGKTAAHRQGSTGQTRSGRACAAAGRRSRAVSTSAHVGCTETQPHQCTATPEANRASLRREHGRSRRCRGGSVALQEQPCLWVEH